MAETHDSSYCIPQPSTAFHRPLAPQWGWHDARKWPTTKTLLWARAEGATVSCCIPPPLQKHCGLEAKSVCERHRDLEPGHYLQVEKKESFMPATHRHPVQMGSVCVRQAAINTRGAVCSRRGAAKKRLYIAQTDSRRVYITAFISLVFRSCTGCSFGSRSHRSCSGSDWAF